MVELNIKILAPHVQCTIIYSCALQQEVKKKKKYFFFPPFPLHRLSSNQVLGMCDTPFACVWFLPLALLVCLFVFSLFFCSFFFVLRWFFMGIGYSGGVVAVLVVSMAVMVVVVVFQLLNEILFYCSVYIIFLC